MPDTQRILRSLSATARLALQNFQDGDTWQDTAERIPPISDGRQRHYHHAYPPLIAAKLIEKTGTRQIKGRAIRDDVFQLTGLGRDVWGSVG